MWGLAKAVKCACGNKGCTNWHVSPYADVQGVNFTKDQAAAVADFLNRTEKREMRNRSMTVSGHNGYLGIIPTMLSPHDERPMLEQLHEGYLHGGGWQPFKGFTATKRGEVWVLEYPGDPPYIERARIEMNDETLCVFDGSWVLVVDKEGARHIARMD